MKLVSILNLVQLETDPPVENGSIYFNTASSLYRVTIDGEWKNLVEENNVHEITANRVVEYGDDSTQTFILFLNESYENNTIFTKSSSTSYIVVGNNIDYPVRIGAEFKIIKAGEGQLQILSASPSISILSPSPIYLTAKNDYIKITKINDDNWLISGEFRDLY